MVSNTGPCTSIKRWRALRSEGEGSRR